MESTRRACLLMFLSHQSSTPWWVKSRFLCISIPPKVMVPRQSAGSNSNEEISSLISKHCHVIEDKCTLRPSLETFVNASNKNNSGYLETCSLDRRICCCHEMKHHASRYHRASGGQKGTRRKRKKCD